MSCEKTLPEIAGFWLQEESKLVFVPGAGDPGPAAVLPRPPLPASLTKELRAALPNAVSRVTIIL